MSHRPTRILLIEDTSEYAELVDDWLCGDNTDGAFTLMWTDSLVAGLKKLETDSPDVILLDLSLPDSKGDTLAKIQAAAPHIPVIVLSAGKGEALALTMIAQGAADYLVKSSCTADTLVRSVRYAMIRHSNAERPVENNGVKNKLIGLMGCKGGMGTTTTAWNLAVNLARQSGEKVLMCDLDLDIGMVSFLAGIEPEHTLRDAVENVARLDRDFFDKIVFHAPNGVDILTSPLFYGAKQLDTGAIEKVIARARGFYKWTVADFGRPSPVSINLSAEADDMVLVTSNSIHGLFATKRFIASIEAPQRDRYRLLVNDLDNNTQRLSSQDLGSMFGLSTIILPYDGGLNNASGENGSPSDAGAFQKQLIRLARSLAGLPEPKPKRGIGSFFRLREESLGV